MRTRREFLAVVIGMAMVVMASWSAAIADVPPPTQGTLTEHNVAGVYVSGLSSGGYMANQLHVAYSSTFDGAGIFSAGPYDCAQNDLNTALYACMDTWMERKTPAELEQLTRQRAAEGDVDPVENLSGDPVWLFHGTMDGTIAEDVNDDLATYYQDFRADVAYNKTSGAGHAWVSPIGPNECSSTSSPYINNCGSADPVGEMLAHLFGAVNPASTAPLTGELIQFDQDTYAPGGNAAAISMGAEGFAYIPAACEPEECTLLVTLHGCYQYFGLVGDALMDKGYLNEYADTNNMIVLYPQATTMSGNPRGCWDWWGYQSSAYPLKSGPQMTAVVNMVEALNGDGGDDPPPTTTPPPTPDCITANNYQHTNAGRAYVAWGYTYALGSDQPLGLWNVGTYSSLAQTGPDYWERC